jgi:pilus assembly protein CpaB
VALPKVNKNALLLLGALALGLVAAVLSISYVQKRVDLATAALEAGNRRVPVVVPKRPLAVGEIVTENDLSVREVPEDLLPADAVLPSEYGNILNRMVRAPVRQGVPLSGSALVPLYDQFSRVINPGKVGYTMQVDEVNSVSGMIAPGDTVDILLSYDAKDAGSGTGQPKRRPPGASVAPLLENVRVLATGQRVGETVGSELNSAFSSVTFELDPWQAETLTVGRKSGQLHVMLRNLDDTTPFGLSGLDEKTLMESMGGASGDDVEYIIGSM